VEGGEEENSSIGRSRDENLCLTDAQCSPLAFMLAGGQVADGAAVAVFLECLSDCYRCTPTKAAATRRPPSG
jgi:hypothetical protein